MIPDHDKRLRNALRRFLLCLSLSLILTLPGFAESGSDSARLRDFGWFEDAGGALAISDVVAAAHRFRPQPDGIVAAGYTNNPIWIRVVVDAPAGEWWLDLLPAFIDEVRLYEVDRSTPTGFSERSAGDLLPFAAREVANRAFVFKLRKPDAIPQVLYLRVRCSNTFLVLPRLSSPDAFHAQSLAEYSLLAANLVLLFAALALNVVAVRHDPLARWFSGSIAALILTLLGLSGFAAQYILPEQPGWVELLPKLGFLLFIALTHGFLRHLLALEENERWQRRWIRIWVVLPALAIPLVWTDMYAVVMPGIVGGVIVSTALCLWFAARKLKTISGGGLVFLSLAISLAGYLGSTLTLLGVTLGYYPTLYVLNFGSLGAIATMHFAVMARNRDLRTAQIEGAERLRSLDREARRQAEARIQQGKLVAMLAHELRNALTVLRMAFALQPMSPVVVASAERSITSMDNVIERTLLAERVADGAVRFELSPCDLVAMVNAVIANCQDPRRVCLTAPRRLTVITDASLLQVIVVNLVENALKYGAGELSLEVLGSPPGAACGPVIRVGNLLGRAGPPDPERLFEKYYRAKGAHGYTGSGLGLHLARYLARQLGGDLLYLPASGRAVFELRLPGSPPEA